MVRYQVILAYDGSQFKGFQRQGKACTVQSTVEAVLRTLGWQGKTIYAAGRTDSGVHAHGQVIAFDLEWKHTPGELQQALNSGLPNAIAARQVRAVPAVFHPRYAAAWRRYRYQVYCQEARDPLLEAFAWRVWPPADLQALQSAAACLNGTHDFSAFGTPPRVGGSTVRTVLAAGWEVEAPGLVFTISANAFLYHMIRRLVFMQVAIAQGRLPAHTLAAALEGAVPQPGTQQPLVHGLAPACGLILEHVYYPPEAIELVDNLEFID